MVDFKVRSVTQASRTTVGTQDFTVSGFGTPTAWIVTVSHTGDGALIGIGFGFHDGVNFINAWSGAAATDADTTAIWASDSDAQFEAQALNYLGPTITTELLEAAASAFVTDGIRLTYTTAPAVALSVRVDLIQCDAAFVGTDTTNANSVSGVGFQGNVLIQANTGGLTSTGGYRPNYGFVADSGGTIYQCNVMMSSGSLNQPTAPIQHVDTSRFLGFLNATPVKTSWSFSAFGVNGFTFADSEGTANIEFNYLVLKVANLSLWAGALQTGTTVATTTYTDPGFAAGGLWVIPTFASTANSTLQTGNNGTTGFGVFTGFEQGSMTCSCEDGLASSNTSSRVSTTSGLLANQDNGTLGYEATLASASGGFSAAFSTANGTARYFLALVWAAGDLFEATDETLALTEQALAHGFYPIAETLGITEEVVYFAMMALTEGQSQAGDSGNTGLEAGQGGNTGLEAGE